MLSVVEELSPRALTPVAVGAAFVYSVIVGGLLVPVVMRRVRPRYHPTGPWHRAAFGFIERPLVMIAVLLLSAEIIAAWLVLKAASSWRGWGEEPGVFNRFVLGTGVSLAFASAGGGIAWGIVLSAPALAIGCAIAPLVLFGMVWSLYPCEGNWWTALWGATVPPGGDIEPS